MLRKLFLAACMLASLSAHACSLTGLQHEARFVADAATLSAEEVASMADWDMRVKATFPGGGKYGIFVGHNSINGVPEALAFRRLKGLETVLASLGVAAGQIEISDVHQRFGDSGKCIEVESLLNIAAVVFQPGCPNPCCP